jgi:hypothetical protein
MNSKTSLGSSDLGLLGSLILKIIAIRILIRSLAISKK